MNEVEVRVLEVRLSKRDKAGRNCWKGSRTDRPDFSIADQTVMTSHPSRPIWPLGLVFLFFLFLVGGGGGG